MAVQSISTIKQWFKTSFKPTQQQFWDWLDSFRHKQDKISPNDIDGLQGLLDAKVDKKDIAEPTLFDPSIAYDYDSNNQQYVSFRNVSSENPQFKNEGFYRLLIDTIAGQSPETNPEKWAYQGQALGEIAIADVSGLQEVLGSKINTSEKGSSNGVASLGADGKVPASQLPIGLDDENVKVGESGTADYLNESYFTRTPEQHIRPKIPAGKIWQGDENGVGQPVDPPTGGGGSISIKNNGVLMTPRTYFNIIGALLEDVAISDEIKMTIKMALASDVNLAGIVNGDLLSWDSLTSKIIPKSVTPFTGILRSSEANIQANGLLSTVVPDGYKIFDISAYNQTTNSAGNVSIGTAALGTQVVNANAVGASFDDSLTVVKARFAQGTVQQLYVSSSNWGTGIITLYFTLIKIR